MPFTYPSHQGLLAPMWRRWPNAFDVPALCVGAAMPDVVDGLIGAFRGHLGHSIGHTLPGIVICIPTGIILWAALHFLMRGLPNSGGDGLPARCWNATRQAFTGAPGPEAFWRRWRLVTASMTIGVVSHIFFDIISHARSPLFWPWRDRVNFFPGWWTTEWWRAPVPLYEGGYGIGPHFVMWMLLNVVGIVLLMWPVLQRRPASSG